MSKQDRTWWHCVGRRSLGHVTGVMLLVVLAMLTRSASAWAAQDARQEDVLEASGGNDVPAKQQAISEAKSPVEESRTASASPRMGTAAGVVVGPDGKPVSGAEIYMKGFRNHYPAFTGRLPAQALPPRQFQEMSNWPTRAMRRGRTDAAGRFTMPLDPGRPGFRAPFSPELLVVAEGFGLGYQRLQLVEDRWEAVDPQSRQPVGDLRIRLPEMVPVRGRLLAPEGTPIEGVAVRARFIVSKNYTLKVCHCNDDFPEYWPRSVPTDAQGSFTLRGIPAGSNVYLNLFHPRFALDSVVVETGPRDIPKVEGTYEPRRVGPTFSHTLSPARPVEGVVTATDTGRPLPGVALLLFHDWLGYPAPACTFAYTDGQGRYRFNCWLAKRYTLSVYPPPDSGYLHTHTVVQPGPSDAERVREDFQVERGKIIRGRILDAETEEPIRGASVGFFLVVHRVLLDGWKGKLLNPAITDEDGRFAVTGTSGPGVLSVETTDPSYLRSQDADRVLRALKTARQAHPMTLFSIQVPAKGDLEEQVVIHLRRGRIVTLQAVGQKGERLSWVGTRWDGMKCGHGVGGGQPAGFVDGKVVVPGVDPNGTTRVFFWYAPRKLAAVFDITPEPPDGPVEVRLQPTATVMGRIVTPDGDPVEDSQVHLRMSCDPQVSQFSRYGWGPAGRYQRYFASSLFQKTDADGRFLFEDLVPGVPLGFSYKNENAALVTVEPLEPGQRRDLGNLVPRATPPVDLPALMRLVGRIGVVPDLSGVGEDQPPSMLVVPGSAAERAGIRSGDRITAMNNRLVERDEDIKRLWRRLSWDDALGRSIAVNGLCLSLLREGKPVEATLTRDLLPGFFGPRVEPLPDDLFEVTFTYQPQKPAEAVYLAGSFNDWNKTAHKMEG
ncbi:MAG: PDZ domain-containing protein, partial [Planctomycetota bacterium]